MFHTARWRLVAWNVLVISVILIALEAAVYVFFNREIYKGVDADLYQREQQAISTMQSAGIGQELTREENDASYRTIIVSPEGAPFSSVCSLGQDTSNPMVTCPPQSDTLASSDAVRQVQHSGGTYVDVRTVTFDGYPWRVITFTAPWARTPYVIQIGRVVAGEAEAAENLNLLLILGGLLGIALSAVGSIFLAGRALIPIRQAFARQRQFTADASHELRTPLALIRANAEMLTRHAERLPGGDGELLYEIIGETDHLNRLVSDLLTLARADTGAVRIESKAVDLRALVEAVHEDVQRIAESRGIASQVTLDGPVNVVGDETRLRQLLLILLDNALKYTDPGGHVDISLSDHDHHAQLVVADTGIGIPAADQAHIFDRFYRVDQARGHESGGTGLGLAIAQWIVHAHNGQIKVDSAIGRGSRFEVSLPAS